MTAFPTFRLRTWLPLTLAVGAIASPAFAQQTYTPYTITTMAGSPGASGFVNATGTDARFNQPDGVAVDGAGNVYVADNNSSPHAVRKITPGGAVTTLATAVTSPGPGDSFGALGGIAIDTAGTNLYATDYSSGAIYKITLGGVVSLFYAGGTLVQPEGLALDSGGNVYVAEAGGPAVRKITPLGVITTLSSSVTAPKGVAVDSSGNVYVADSSAAVIRKITGGTATIYAGQQFNSGTVDGNLATALFNHPVGIAIDGTGNLFVTDAQFLVRKIASDGTVTSLAGSTIGPGSTDGTGNIARFSFSGSNPAGIAVDHSSAIYVTDFGNNTIRQGTVSSAIPPVITAQPQSQSVNSGATATFSVTVSGTGPFIYQWNAGGGAVIGATNQSYTTGNPGSYQVVVQGPGGAVFSNFASLSVNATPVPPSFTTQPSSATAPVGATVTFTAAASNSPTYQWQFNGANIVGATSASYMLTTVTSANAGNYAVVATNSGGTATSATAVLTVATAPAITVQPQSVSVAAGGNITLQVTATGTGTLTYQWQKNGAPIGGATGASLALTHLGAADGATYTVVITNTYGSIQSSGAVLTVTPAGSAPSITAQPQSTAPTAGAPASFQVTATGTGTLTYQWQKNGTAIAGATGANLAFTSVATSDAGSYTVVVTNAYGSVQSSAATMTVHPGSGPSITVQPLSQTAAAGSSQTLSVTAGGTGTLTYQWYDNGVAIAGATGPTLTFSNLGVTSAGSYTVTVTDGNGVSSTSAAAVLGVNVNARLVNLSILSTIQGSLSMGFVIGGTTANVSENLLVRAVGPSIGPGTLYNVPGVMPDPVLSLAIQSPYFLVKTDAGWGTPADNVAAVQSLDNATGAFPLTDPTSKDSALVASLTPTTGGYSATVAGATGDGGYALTEVYDNSPNYAAGDPRLVNLSCLTTIATGSTLDVGFVVGGTTGETLLIRVTGPALAAAPFNLSGTMPDPQLSVHPANATAFPTAPTAANARWAGNAQITAADWNVGAFALSDPTSKDSALLITVPSGVPYAVEVSSATGTGGKVLVEIYEMH